MTKQEIEKIAHEIWAAARVMPGEGIEDGVDRVIKILEEKFGIVSCNDNEFEWVK